MKKLNLLAMLCMIALFSACIQEDTSEEDRNFGLILLNLAALSDSSSTSSSNGTFNISVTNNFSSSLYFHLSAATSTTTCSTANSRSFPANPYTNGGTSTGTQTYDAGSWCLVACTSTLQSSCSYFGQGSPGVGFTIGGSGSNVTCDIPTGTVTCSQS